MTQEEALNYLTLAPEEDVEDAFERVFFEHKQFFLSKPLLQKTAEGRIAKLQHLVVVRNVLGLLQKVEHPVVQLEFDRSENILTHFTNYSKAKQGWKTQVTQVHSVEALLELIESGLQLERVFVSEFQEFADWTDEVPVIGSDIDSMQFLKLLREQTEKGKITLTDLWKSKTELPIELLRALKRLSLLKNYL